MAISPSLYKQRYNNLSVEELEKKYNDLKKLYIFNSKEEYVKDLIEHYIFASRDVNRDSEKKALEELLLEKTGRNYTFKKSNYDIDLSDIIKYIVNNDSYLYESINKFMSSLEIDDNNKKIFLVELYQDRNNFNNFLKEILNDNDSLNVYSKYKKIAEEYISQNLIIG